MDIAHCVNALAALTLGKDMTFRDYAQGAYRMRGVGKGQRIELLITPEIRTLAYTQLKAANLADKSAILRQQHEDGTVSTMPIASWSSVTDGSARRSSSVDGRRTMPRR